MGVFLQGAMSFEKITQAKAILSPILAGGFPQQKQDQNSPCRENRGLEHRVGGLAIFPINYDAIPSPRSLGYQGHHAGASAVP
jgi:hypothetical protein